MARGVNKLDEAKLQNRLLVPDRNSLYFWYDANDLTTLTVNSSSQVTSIKDNSKNASSNTLTNITNTPPLLGTLGNNNALSFAGGYKSLRNSGTIYPTGSNPWTALLVAQNNLSSFVEIVSFGDNATGARVGIWLDSSRNIGVECVGSYVYIANSGSKVENPFLFGAKFPSNPLSNINFRLNGEAQTTTVFTDANLNVSGNKNLCLGTIAHIPDTDPSYHFNGKLGEVLFFNSAISDDVLVKIEGLLIHKWKLFDYCANHPYKNNPPLR